MYLLYIYISNESTRDIYNVLVKMTVSSYGVSTCPGPSTRVTATQPVSRAMLVPKLTSAK